MPLARAVDGLAAQIAAYRPRGQAARLNALWHDAWENPSGLTFREPHSKQSEEEDVRELLDLERLSPQNLTFRRMVSSLATVLEEAVSIRQCQPEIYASLVRGALQKQLARDWLIPLGGMLALIEEARHRRPLGGGG